MRSVLVLVLAVVAPAFAAPRVKPKAPHPLVGRWVAVKVVGYGRDETENNKDFSYTFPDDGGWLIRDGDGGRGRCVVKGTSIDLITDTGRAIPAIFELKGDTLSLCLGEVGDGRPTEIKTGARLTYIVMKRNK